jgi:lipopolysaccharide/colanic/teichoic acid biosynthesis glycosyltransferase
MASIQYKIDGIHLNSYSSRLYLVSKRVLDLTIAAVLLAVLSPLMLLIGALVKLTTSGPAIFKQERVGLGYAKFGFGQKPELRKFEFYKFRTMYVNASSERHRQFIEAYINDDNEGMAALQEGEISEHNKYKMVGDPRVTPLGRFLRKTSLDELPQFWNVVRGDMSLVGPRPAIPYEVEMYKPWHYRRLAAQPGITGLWQTTARSSLGFDEMVEVDIEYIDRQSFWLDLSIIIHTPFAILSAKGAE